MIEKVSQTFCGDLEKRSITSMSKYDVSAKSLKKILLAHTSKYYYIGFFDTVQNNKCHRHEVVINT